MEHSFWHNKWEKRQIGFHLEETNPLLMRHFPSLQLEKGSRVFVPLCGKSLDIHWLLKQGYFVVGAELNQSAIIELFQELGLEPKIEQLENFMRYSALNLEVYVGDVFNLVKEDLGAIDAIYDRAAFVALPYEMRKNYSELLPKITHQAKQLLIVFDYDQSAIEGPPFSTPESMIIDFYGSNYTIDLLEKSPLEGGLKGKVKAYEVVCLLT